MRRYSTSKRSPGSGSPKKRKLNSPTSKKTPPKRISPRKRVLYQERVKKRTPPRTPVRPFSPYYPPRSISPMSPIKLRPNSISPFKTPPSQVSPFSVSPRSDLGSPPLLYSPRSVSTRSTLGSPLLMDSPRSVSTRSSLGSPLLMDSPRSVSPRSYLGSPPLMYSPRSVSPRSPLGTPKKQPNQVGRVGGDKLKKVSYFYREKDDNNRGRWKSQMEIVDERWTAGKRLAKMSVARRESDRSPNEHEVLRDMLGDYKQGDFDPRADQHDQEFEWPVPKQTYDAALKLFKRAIGQTNAFDRTIAVTEDNPMGTPNLAPNLTRTDFVGRRQRRRFLRQNGYEKELIKNMQRKFEESMKSDDENY